MSVKLMIDKKNVSERIKKIILSNVEDVSEIPDDSTFDSLGIDSLTLVEILFDIEDEFSVSWTDDNLRANEIESLPELIDFIYTLCTNKS